MIEYLVRWRMLLLCAAFAVSAGAASADPFDIHVELEQAKLTLVARDAPLHEVMREIGEAAGFETLLVGSFADAPLLTLSFENLSLDAAIERLVRAENRIIVHAPSSAAGPPRIAQVWLLQTGSENTELTAAKSHSIESGSAEDVNGYKLARLTEMLQPDQAEFVRARAAMALGKFDDERAVLALEFALEDLSPAVRSQAINALGLIGSERASEALVGLIRGDLADTAERAAATRALARHDNATAREFLREIE